MSIFDQNQVIKILRSLGPIDLDYFNNRLRLQKLGFLAQELGAKDGFPYSWYLRGPYSSSLAGVLFMGVEVDAFKDKVSLSIEEKHVVDKMRMLLGKEIDDPRTLELYASVMYLMPNRKLSQDDISNIVQVMAQEKPDYDKDEVQEVIRKIKKFQV